MDPFTSAVEKFVITTLPHSEISIKGEVSFELILPYREKALKTIASTMTLPGFRKGYVPTPIALKNIGEMTLLEEAVELFFKDFYPTLISERKIDAVGRPSVRITKLAPSSPVELDILTAIYPEVKIPENWKSIQKDVEVEIPESVTEEDLQKALITLQENKKTKEGDSEILPELNDDFAKSFGVDNLELLKHQIKENLDAEKKQIANDKRRNKIIDILLDKSSVEIPSIFVESEQDKIINQLKSDITRMGLTFEDYLNHSKKNEDSIRDEFKAQAEKRAKLQLVLNKLADIEKIEVDEKTVATEVGHAIEHFPDAKKELVQVHVETVLRNEKILQLLESDGKKE